MKISRDQTLTIEKSENFTQTAFTIKASREAFEILSSGLYSDKQKAIIRELSTNAYDAHVAAELDGIKDRAKRPFDVSLPSRLNPIFKIRDYGTGLSEADVFNLYTTYFGSTKQDSDDFIGALGLGSKSPFSLVSSFLVISFFNNVKTVYTAIIGEDGFPSIVKMHSEPTSEENGIEINVTVSPDEVQNFHNRAQIVYQHFNVRPNFIGSGPTFKEIKYRNQGTKWAIADYTGSSVGAIQGQICYDVSLSALDGKIPADLYSLYNQVQGMFYFFFNIGEVDIQASREALSYTPRTIAAVEKVLQNFKNELYIQVINRIEKATSYINAVYEFNRLLNYERTAVYGINLKWKKRNLSTQFSITDTFHVKRGELVKASTLGVINTQLPPVYHYDSYVAPFKRIAGTGELRNVTPITTPKQIKYDPKYPDSISCALSRTSDITFSATPYQLGAFEVVLNDGKLPLYKLREYLKKNMNDVKDYFVVDLKNEAFVENLKAQFGISTHLCTKNWEVDIDRGKTIKSVRLFTGREYKPDYYNKFNITSGFSSASDVNDLDSTKVKYYVVSKGSAYKFPDLFNIKGVDSDAKYLNNVVYCFYKLGILPDQQRIVVVSHTILEEFRTLFPKIKPLSEVLKLQWKNLKPESQVAISNYLSYNEASKESKGHKPLDLFGPETNFMSWLEKNTKNSKLKSWAKSHFDTLQQIYTVTSKQSVYTDSYYADVLPIIQHMFGKLQHNQTSDIARVSLIKNEIKSIFPMFNIVKERFTSYYWLTEFTSVVGYTDTLLDYLEWDWNNFKQGT
jgi:hypothetical protein